MIPTVQHKQPQLADLYRKYGVRLEHEILRKPIPVPADLFVETLRLDAVHGRQVLVQQDVLIPDLYDQRLDPVDQD
jgi:hypothetical protein